MRLAIKKGIITGVADTTVIPQGIANHAMCDSMLMRTASEIEQDLPVKLTGRSCLCHRPVLYVDISAACEQAKVDF